MVICKPRHWNLGIGIGIGTGIGTDITNAIISSSISLWTPILPVWWLWMRGPHPQSHVTLRYHGHVTSKTRYISTFTRPVDAKLSRVVTLYDGISSTKSHDTSVTWSRNKSKMIYSTLTRPTDPKLCMVVAQDEEISCVKSHDTSTTWSQNFMSSLSQDLWAPNLAGWWLKMRGPQPQSRVALQYRGRVTNKKRYISTFTRPNGS